MYTLFILKLVGGATGDEFGASLLSLHDLDGDGIDDLVVGAPGEDSAGTDAGAVYVYAGASSGYLDTGNPSVIHGTAAGDGFGRHLAIGDVDGDGQLDLAVSGDGCECVTVVSTLDAFATRTVLTGTTGTGFGGTLDLGDVNGDGYSDLVVGAPGDDTNGVDAGAAYVYSGSASGLSASPDETLLGEDTGDGFGTAVLDSLDADGDGDDEVVVGAPAGGAGDYGAVYAWYGGSAGLASTADATWPSGYGTIDFGSQLSAGDFEGDGYDDVAVVGYELDGVIVEIPGAAGGLGSVTSLLSVIGYLDTAVTGPGADGDGDGRDDLPVRYDVTLAVTEECQDHPTAVAAYGDLLELPEVEALAPAGDVEAGARDELWVSSAADSGSVYLAISVADADGDGYADGFGGTLADCDDAQATVHPLASETNGDGFDSDCDGADDAPVSTAPTCRTVASLVQARALLDADQRITTDVPALMAETEAVLAVSPDVYAVEGDDGTNAWSRGWMPENATISGSLLQKSDTHHRDGRDAWGRCTTSTSEASLTALDARWSVPTPSGLVSANAAHEEEDGTIDRYIGVAVSADGSVRAFDTEVRSGTYYAEGYDWIEAYAFEGLTDSADGCTFTYDYKSGEDDYGAWSGSSWSFADGTHRVDVSSGYTEVGCDQATWTMGRVDARSWHPIDPTTWADLGTIDADGDGWPADAGDCDDADAEVNPCAVETAACDDRNCDGRVEDDDHDGVEDCVDCAPDDATVGGPTEWFGGDDDGDGYGDTSLGLACSAPEPEASSIADCDDSDPLHSPKGKEDCDGADDDCDGEVDETAREQHYLDLDGDGYGKEGLESPAATPCDGPTLAGDCDDLDEDTFPGAPEVPGDGIDQDCDGKDDAKPSPAPEPPQAGEPGCFGNSALLFGALGLAGGVRRRRGKARPR